MQAPVMVMNTNTKRESGRQTQLANIQAAKVNILPFLGSCRYCDLHSGPSIHVEDAPRPNGRYCHD